MNPHGKLGKSLREELLSKPELPPICGLRARDPEWPSSAVGIFKHAYRSGSKCQRKMMAAWFRRVLAGEDSPP